MNKGILTVTVNPAVDVTVTLPSSGELRMRRSTNCILSAGGKGVNVARALRALRARVLAVGLAGGGPGALLRKLLRDEKIPCAFVRTREPARVNFTLLGPRSGRGGRVLGDGPRLTAGEIRRFESRYRRWLRGRRLVVLSGRNAAGAPVDWYARLVRLARREGVPAAVDTSGAPLLAALKARPFLVKPNREEAEEVLGIRLDSPANIKEAVRRLHARGVRVVLLSLGRRGAVGSDGKEIWRARPPRILSKNDVGCGDAFLGGFIQARGGGKSLPEALRFAVACGTAGALNSTPGLIHAGDVLRLVKKVTLQPEGHGLESVDEWPSGRIPPHRREEEGATPQAGWGSTVKKLP